MASRAAAREVPKVCGEGVATDARRAVECRKGGVTMDQTCTGAGPGGAGETPQVGSYYIRGCLQGAVRKGQDPRRILGEAGIDPAAWDDPAASIDGVALQRLFLATSRVLDDAYLGFLDVQVKLRMSYMVSVTAVNSATLGEALRNMARFVNAVRSDVDLRFRLDAPPGNDAAMVIRMHGVIPRVDPQLLYWFETHWFYKFLCWLVGRRIRLTRVCLLAREVNPALDYGFVLDCPIELGADAGALHFDRECLRLPVIRSEVELRRGDFVNGHADWFEIPGNERTLVRRVEQLLVDLYRTSKRTPTLQVVADLMHASPRTISRRLCAEQASFQDIKDKVRRELADELLRQTDLPVSKIATKVGFWEPAAFARAYCQWTGMTPTEFRAQR